jgi:hypothetical protein
LIENGKSNKILDMKIGILSFHCARNYGAVLQCYCLTKVLSSLHHDVKVIDYRPSYIVDAYPLFQRRWLKHPISLLRFVLYLPATLQRRRHFDRFIASLPLCPLPFDRPDNDFDAFVFGSDQIWNPFICDGFDPAYFAGKTAFAGKLKISYAASTGDVTLTEGERETFLRLLGNFDVLGVRETSLQAFLEDHGISSTFTADPVVLAGKGLLDEIAGKVPPARKTYVLSYEIAPSEKVDSFARMIAKELGCRVISVARGNFSRGRINISPRQFVALFRDAAFIVTSSFHGTALSVMFGKPFYAVFTDSYADARMHSFLSYIGLVDRMIREQSQIHPHEEILFEPVQERVERLRKKSFEFLEKSLRGIKYDRGDDGMT